MSGDLQLVESAKTWQRAVPPSLDWSQLAAFPATLAARSYSNAHYHAGRGRLFILLGYLDGGTFTNEVIDVDLATEVAVALSPSGTPPAARYAAMSILDAARNRVISFGGVDGGGAGDYYNDLHALALEEGAEAWSTLAPVGGPPPRRAGGLFVLDSINDRGILIGGFNLDTGHLIDVWELALSTLTWTQLAPGGVAPSARYEMAGIFDPRDGVNGRAVIFGGAAAGGPQNDLVELDLTDGAEAWATLSPGGTAPNVRAGALAAYDSHQLVMLLTGGFDSTPALDTYFNDLHKLTLVEGSETWSEYSPTSQPPARRALCGDYDAGRRRLTIYGGWTLAGTMLDDAWKFQHGPWVETVSIPEGDLDLDDDDDLLVTSTDITLVRQRLQVVLRWFRGEYYLDTSRGVPYFQDVHKKAPNLALVDAILRDAVLGTEGVEELQSFSTMYDQSTREFTVTLKALTADGVVELEETVP